MFFFCFHLVFGRPADFALLSKIMSLPSMTVVNRLLLHFRAALQTMQILRQKKEHLYECTLYRNVKKIYAIILLLLPRIHFDRDHTCTLALNPSIQMDLLLLWFIYRLLFNCSKSMKCWVQKVERDRKKMNEWMNGPNKYWTHLFYSHMCALFFFCIVILVVQPFPWTKYFIYIWYFF